MSMTVVANPRFRLRICLLWSAVLGMVCLLATHCLAGEPTPAVPLSETTSLFAAIVKVFGSLLVVVGLMLVLLYFLKRTGLGGAGHGRGGSAITILETRMVAPKKYIAIVEIAGHCLALGITDHAINLLTDLGPEAKALLDNQPSPVNPGSTFASLLTKSMKSWQTKAARNGGAVNHHQEDTKESS